MDLGTFIGEVPDGAVVELEFGHELRGAEHVGPFPSEGEVAAGMVKAASIGSFKLDALAANSQASVLDGQRDGMRNAVADSGISCRVVHKHTAVRAGNAGRGRGAGALGRELRVRAAYEHHREQKK